MLFVIIAEFFVCWAPIHILNTVSGYPSVDSIGFKTAFEWWLQCYYPIRLRQADEAIEEKREKETGNQIRWWLNDKKKPTLLAEV